MLRKVLQRRIFGDDDGDLRSACTCALDVAAYEVAARRGTSIEVRRRAGLDAPSYLPANATHFERGLTLGLSLALLTEPASLAPYLREALELLEPTLRGQHPDKCWRGEMHAAIGCRRRPLKLVPLLPLTAAEARSAAPSRVTYK